MIKPIILVSTPDRIHYWEDLVPMFHKKLLIEPNKGKITESQVSKLISSYAFDYLVFLDIPKDIFTPTNTRSLQMYNIYRMIESTSVDFAREYVLFIKKLSDASIEFEIDPYLSGAMEITMFPATSLYKVKVQLKEIQDEVDSYGVEITMHINHSKLKSGVNDILIAYTEHYVNYEEVSNYIDDIVAINKRDYILNNIDVFNTPGLVVGEKDLGLEEAGKWLPVIKTNNDKPQYNPKFYERLVERILK